MSKLLRVAIAGFGKSAQNIHTPLIMNCDGLKPVSVLKRSGNIEFEGSEEIKVVRDLESLLNDPMIDLIVITTPNHLHFNMAEASLKAGKHVVVDKPFTVTANEAELLIELAQKQDRKLTVFQNRRWDGDFLSVKKLIQNQEIGELVEFESTFNRFRNELRENAWKEKNLPGSGILYDLGPHLIDQALQLFGMPDSIYADIRSQRGGDTDDWFEINLYYPSLKVKLKAGMLVLDDTPRFILRGKKGAFVKYGFDPQEAELAKETDLLSENWGKDSESNYGILREWNSGDISERAIETERGNYLHFYQNLFQSIQNGDILAVDPNDAKQTIRLIELARESYKKGCRISLDF